MSDPIPDGWWALRNTQATRCAGCGVMVRVGEEIRFRPGVGFAHPGCEQDVPA